MAIIAAVFTVGASAAAIIRAGRVRDLAYTVSPGDGSDASRSAAPWLLGDGYDMVILSGFQGSPEYEGLAEWLNFIAGYECDMDEADYWSKNDPDFVGNKYPMHSVYDSVMEAKLLEIAGKYGLELHDGADLSGEAIPDFLKNGAENWGGYTMGESFHFDGDAQVPGAGNIAYQFMLSKKGRLIEGNLLNVGDASAY
ncbi:MAG: hypothetical protein FWE86_05560, partial [Oscillospiraceae bacterium]|nr:hypothetical protein [Oscillospiraceae bacterium]